MPRVSEAYKDEVRNRLVDAAQRCIERQGLNGFSTREVTDEAGVAKGALYHYFESKEALMLEVARRTQVAVVERVLERANPDATSVEDFLRVFLVELFAVAGHGDSISLLLHARAREDAKAAELLRDNTRFFVTGMEPFVHAAQRQGLLRDDIDAAALIETIGVFVSGLDLRHVAGNFYVAQRAVVRAFLQLLTRGTLADARAQELEQRIIAAFDAENPQLNMEGQP